MKPKYIQVDCKESKKVDLRQAKAILKYRPDIVILEYPNNKKVPGIELNDYAPLEKPQALIAERLKPFSDEVLALHPWAKSDLFMWQNIARLWSDGHQTLLYLADGPSELTSEWIEVWNHMYPRATRNWVWWVQIYLRERCMANNVQHVLDTYKDKPNPVVAIFLEDFHWQHVKFLLAKPSQADIWQYYFGRFADEVTQDTIAVKIEGLNPVFFKYWQQLSDFK